MANPSSIGPRAVGYEHWSLTTREPPRDDGHEIGQVQYHAVDVLDLNVLILHEHPGHPRAGGDAAAAGFKGKKRFVPFDHPALDAKHGLAASVEADKVTGCPTPLGEL